MGNTFFKILKDIFKHNEPLGTFKRTEPIEPIIFENGFSEKGTSTKMCFLNDFMQLNCDKLRSEQTVDTKLFDLLNKEIADIRRELAETRTLIKSLEVLMKDLSTKVEISLREPVVRQGIPLPPPAPPPPPPPPPPSLVPTLNKSLKKVSNVNKNPACKMVVTLEDLKNVKLRRTPVPSKKFQNDKKEINFVIERSCISKKLDLKDD